MKTFITAATAAAVAAAGIALTVPAIASAQPEWDLGAYDQCVGSFDGNPSTSAADYKRWQDHMKMCCEKTGGVFKYAGPGGCVAPPAEPQKFTSRVIPSDVIRHELTAAP